MVWYFRNMVLNLEPMSISKEMMTVAQMSYRIQCLDFVKRCFMYLSGRHTPNDREANGNSTGNSNSTDNSNHNQ